MIKKLFNFLKQKFLSEILLKLNEMENSLEEINFILKNPEDRNIFKKFSIKIIRPVFIIQSFEFWNSLEPIIKKMAESSEFDPIILLIPSRYSEHEEYLYRVKENNFKELKIPIFIYDELIKINTDCLELLSPDIVFRQAPWEHLVPENVMTKNLMKYKLCYVPYGSPMTNVGAVFFNQPLHNYAWRIYNDIEFHYANYSLYNLTKSINVKTVGDTKLESIYNKLNTKYNTYNFKMNEKLKLLWCPHHSMDNWLGFCTFHKNYNDIYDFAAKNQDIDIIFRPHPAMKTAILVNDKMSENEYNQFFDKFLKLENVRLDYDSDYIDLFEESSLLVSDGIAFLVDYLMTGKPIIYFDSQCSVGFNDYYTEFHSCWYKVISVNEVEERIKCIKLGNDELKSERITYAKILFDSTADLPSDLIIRDLLDGLKIQ